jgi:hypothetical protein
MLAEAAAVIRAFAVSTLANEFFLEGGKAIASFFLLSEEKNKQFDVCQSCGLFKKGDLLWINGSLVASMVECERVAVASPIQAQVAHGVAVAPPDHVSTGGRRRLTLSTRGSRGRSVGRRRDTHGHW